MAPRIGFQQPTSNSKRMIFFCFQFQELKSALKNGREVHGNRLVFEKTSGIFYDFYNIIHFDEFYRSRCFNFSNSVLTKKLEMDFSFFRIF
jgi:hypothetical protein